MHGALPWTADRQRRLALFRFAPANFAYGRGYLAGFGEGVMDLCTPQQRAVLEGPYATRLERPLTTAKPQAAPPPVKTRNPTKSAHDAATFGTKYF